MQTPLHLAAREGNGKCIEVLLENGADYMLENDRKETALKLATDKSCHDQLESTIARLEVPQRSRIEEDIVESAPKRKYMAFYSKLSGIYYTKP